MTAEVLIMRQNGIILAGDKAETTPDNKSYITSKKIFNLANNYPAGMMINGYVDFEGIFIGDLIEEFKKVHDFKKIGNIEEIKNRFIEFLEKNTPYTSKKEYLNRKVDLFREEIEIEIQDYGFDEVINFHGRKEVGAYLKSISDFNSKFYDLIPADMDKTEWNFEMWRIFSDWLSYEGTGVIITGYNSYSYYPTFFEINIHCNDDGTLMYEEVDSRVDWEEPFIKVFAIKEEAYAFLTGVNEEFEGNVKETIEKLDTEFIHHLKNQLMSRNFDCENIEEIANICKLSIANKHKNINQSINKYKKESLQYTIESLEFLPQELLCNLADYLIQLTGLKQKIFSELETVSIETDVGLITKSEYFKWIKHDIETFKY